MSKLSKAQNLCDELYESLTNRHGFTMIGDSYGWEMGYMIVDWKTHIGDGISTVDPDDLETLGKTIDEIACKYAFKLIKIQSNQLGYGNCYFKEINCSTSIIADS